MITEAFDTSSEAIISPAAFMPERKMICPLAIATFSREIFASALGKYPHEQIGEFTAANRVKPIHLLRADGVEVVFYLSELGSAMAATDVIEANWKTGADRFILFGSAGALDEAAIGGRYILPTAAYRDEGMSYHYAPPADYIPVRNADFLAEVFEANGFPWVKGKIWTTDAFYMETREKVRRRKAEGCIAVEMEVAGVQAVCDYHGFELYDFLAAGDVVDQEVYTPDGLHRANHSTDKLDVALAVARAVGERAQGAGKREQGKDR